MKEQGARTLLDDEGIEYFWSPGIRAATRIANAKLRGITCLPLGGMGGIGIVSQPNRFTKVEAAEREERAAYLRPYDVFEYLPRSTEFLSAKRSKGFKNCLLKRGTLLQSCSGRNLGPAVFVDSYLEKFVIGSDMIRIDIEDENLRSYVLAYLQSETGQELLTQGKTGSVIDHVSKAHIEKLEIPIFGEAAKREITLGMSKAIMLREAARITLDAALSAYEQALPNAIHDSISKINWTVNARDLTDRLDAASYDPFVSEARNALRSAGGSRVDTVASVLKPAGRYKTCYVDREYGCPILSGTQLLQLRPINLKYIAPRAFKNPEDYELQKGWLVYQADGRAEESLGLPVMVTSERHGWLASGHVGRVIHNEGVDPGWLYLALRSSVAQIQIKALASGSVVDSTFCGDMESVILPPRRDDSDFAFIQAAWEQFAESQRLEAEAVALVETTLADSALAA